MYKMKIQARSLHFLMRQQTHFDPQCSNLYVLYFSLTFFYLGMATMLPWNFLISITAFWNYKFRRVDNSTTEINQTTLAFTENYEALHSGSIWEIPIPPVPIIKPTDMQVSFPSYVAIASNIPGAITTLLHSGFGQRVR